MQFGRHHRCQACSQLQAEQSCAGGKRGMYRDDSRDGGCCGCLGIHNIIPVHTPAFRPCMNALPAAPPTTAIPVSFRADNQTCKQKVLFARQKDLLDDRWRAKKVGCNSWRRRSKSAKRGCKRWQLHVQPPRCRLRPES